MTYFLKQKTRKKIYSATHNDVKEFNVKAEGYTVVIYC